MELEAPTFRSLNKPQRRALLLRDNLRNIDPRHLDDYIDGIVLHEPPNYRMVNGVIHPSLVSVTLKATASRLDLGNVHFDNEGTAVAVTRHTYLTVEDGLVELRTEDALPADEKNLDSVPIHIFMAKTMVPMFEAKFRAIHARLNKINEIRQAAYNATIQPVMRFRSGETLSGLDQGQRSERGNSASFEQTSKRKPGDPVLRHISNKRNKVGLDTISNNSKSATFDTIPAQIKVDLFNSVVKTAFPNFDNLMMASWNVVSIYSNVGTDFPELHKAIVELKSTLQDFETACDSRTSREEPKFRHDFAPQAQIVSQQAVASDEVGRSRYAAEATGHDSHNFTVSLKPEPGNASPRARDSDSLFVSSDSNDTDHHGNMEPPRLLHINHRQADRGEEEDDRQSVSSHVSSKTDRRRDGHLSHQHPLPSRQETNPSSSRSSPSRHKSWPTHDPRSKDRLSGDEASKSRATPELLRHREEYGSRVGTSNDQSFDREKQSANEASRVEYQDQRKTRPSLADLSLPELKQRYNNRKAHLIQTFNGTANIPQQHRQHLSQLQAEIMARQNEGDNRQEQGDECGRRDMAPNFLGNSLLGPKKSSTVGGVKTPIAPMLHTAKGGQDQEQPMKSLRGLNKRKDPGDEGGDTPNKKAAM